MWMDYKIMEIGIQWSRIKENKNKEQRMSVTRTWSMKKNSYPIFHFMCPLVEEYMTNKTLKINEKEREHFNRRRGMPVKK